MTHRLRPLAVVLLLALPTLPARARAQAPAASSADTARAVSSPYTGFGLRLFRAAAAERPGENVLVSPAGAALALLMAHDGARGETRDAMARALAGDAGADALARALATLPGGPADPDSVLLEVASSLWTQRDAPVRPEYARALRRRYGAEAASLELGSAAAVQRINTWGSRATRGRIPRLLDAPPGPDVRLLLVSAVYFRGRWDTEFGEATTEERFHAPAGPVVRPTMHHTYFYDYLRGPGFQAVRLPYRDLRFAFYVLLPDSGTTPAALAERIDERSWEGWMARMSAGKGTYLQLALPRFTFTSAGRMDAALREMGMEPAFDRARADFGGITPSGAPGLFLGGVLQKSFIRVDEQGTEAASLTEVSGWGLGPPPEPIEVRVDRPFLFAIRDDRTGALLFLGQVTDPR